MAKKPVNIEETQEGNDRFILTTYDEGQTVRCRVDPNKKPTRKARKPIARAWSEKLDRTKKKRF